MEATKPGRLVTGIFQVLLMGAACAIAYWYTRSSDIIPRSVLPLPPVYVSTSDMLHLGAIFCTTLLVQVAGASFAYGTPAFASPQRFAREYLWYLVAYTTASLYAFIATTINYDAQLVAGIGLFSTFFYLLSSWIVFARYTDTSVLASVGQGLAALLRRVLSWSGLAVIVYFLFPLALGFAFAKDRDIANRITQVRIWFNPEPASEWGFRNFLPNVVFEQPLMVVQAPGDDQSIYVLERVGRVYHVDLGGDRTPQLILDITDQLGVVEVENGALGFDFHPAFNGRDGTHPYLYLYYTDTRPDSGQANRLSRFDLSGPDLVSRKASEQPIMVLEREGSGFHNGGSVVFGPDDYLYIAFGEGVRTPQGSRSSNSLRAGIMRIDVSDVNAAQGRGLAPEPFAHGTLAGYTVPPDNPFVGKADVRNEYWAMGLRNPFRISFDPETQALWAGDVGSTVWEEVNVIKPGRHYGYPMVEGRESTGRQGWDSLELPMQEPVYTYVHTAYDRAVIGGIVNRGEAYPGLADQYIFADNYSSKLFALPARAERVDEVALLARANQFAQRGVSSVTQLSTGEILVTTLGAASSPSGEVLLLVTADNADIDETSVTAAGEAETAYDERSTAALFRSNCGRCHGVLANGEGPDSGMLGVPMPDMSSAAFYRSRTDEDIYKVIAEGGAAHGMSALMPPWAEVLSEQEINDLVRYLKSLPDE
ncbi:MAG: PQQ-dependent sugar dehydrogenase [Chromatocurvus sp.]